MGKDICIFKLGGLNGCAQRKHLVFALMIYLISVINPITSHGQVLIHDVSDYSSFNITCFGESDGWIDLSISGGSAPYAVTCMTQIGIVFDTIQHTNISGGITRFCLLYTSPSPRDLSTSRMPSSA